MRAPHALASGTITGNSKCEVRCTFHSALFPWYLHNTPGGSDPIRLICYPSCFPFSLYLSAIGSFTSFPERHQVFRRSEHELWILLSSTHVFEVPQFVGERVECVPLNTTSSGTFLFSPAECI